MWFLRQNSSPSVDVKRKIVTIRLTFVFQREELGGKNRNTGLKQARITAIKLFVMDSTFSKHIEIQGYFFSLGKKHIQNVLASNSML